MELLLEQMHDQRPCLFTAPSGEEVEEKAFWNLTWGSASETGVRGRETRSECSVFQWAWWWELLEEEEPRFQRKEPHWSQTHLLLQLPGLLSPEQHLVPGFLVGVCHQCVSVVRSQLWEEQPSEAGSGGAWAALGICGAGLKQMGDRGAPLL